MAEAITTIQMRTNNINHLHDCTEFLGIAKWHK